ncbi:MAG: tRNA-dihydrouridine synthase [Planctomycetota bacterium]
MQQPQIIKDTIRLTKERVQTPVFMKIRRGFDDSAAATADFWTICENAAAGGVDMLAIQPQQAVWICWRFTDAPSASVIAARPTGTSSPRPNDASPN